MRWRWRWLGSWWFVGSVVVLAINDHLLKDVFPGWWTGKLSDVVGPGVMATLLAVLVGRTPAVLVTAVAFTALKTVPGVAELAAPILGGITRRDLTDLLGLVALPLAWWQMGRATDPQVPRSVSAMSSALRSTARHVAAIVGATAALLAVTATSYDDVSSVTELVVDRDGRVYANVDPGDTRQLLWSVNVDDATTWKEVERGPRRVARRQTTEACRSDESCFRATGRSVEERPPGGSWRHSYGLTSDQERLIDYRTYGRAHDVDQRFDGVLVVDTPAGELVLVDASDDGIVVLDTDGVWHRRSVAGAGPTDISGAMWPLTLAQVAFLAAAPAALLGIILQCDKSRAPYAKPIGCGPPIAALVIAALFWGAGSLVWAVLAFNRLDPIRLATILAIFALLTVLAPRRFLRDVMQMWPA